MRLLQHPRPCSGHVRIYDAEVLKTNGNKKNLFWFDIVKEPKDYQDKFIAHLKAYGPLKDQSPTKLAFLDQRLEMKCVEYAREEEERLKDSEAYKQWRGIGFKGRRGGRGDQSPN